MGTITTNDKHYKNIAAKIREKTYSSKPLNPSEMHTEIEGVYETGKIDGITEGYVEGWNDGELAEYDKFWDAYQSNGERTNYEHAFSRVWNDSTFLPKYDIVPTYGNNMFSYNSTLSDISACLEKANVILDTSNATALTNLFYSATGITKVPKISFENCKEVRSTWFACSNLSEIEELALSQDGSNTFIQTFDWCSKLVSIRISGKIGNSVSFHHSPLDAMSIVSIIEHLSDDSTNQTLTLNRAAVSSADWSVTNYANWEALVATKPNWIISLV